MNILKLNIGKKQDASRTLMEIFIDSFILFYFSYFFNIVSNNKTYLFVIKENISWIMNFLMAKFTPFM